MLIDGSIEAGEVRRVPRLHRLLEWADRLAASASGRTRTRRHDARVARLFGAEGIGLCRTEHMFFGENAHRGGARDDPGGERRADRRNALAKLLPMQREDFVGIFREMGDRPVTIRLLDPPLHEFLPHDDEADGAASRASSASPADKLRERVRALHETEPDARPPRLPPRHHLSRDLRDAGPRDLRGGRRGDAGRASRPMPEVMIPLVGTRGEFERLQRARGRRRRSRSSRRAARTFPYLVGTMIEIPRAALRADGHRASTATFFSFGTNDLTQMTYGYSRDDAGIVPAGLHRRGDPAGRPVPSHRPGRRRASSSRSATEARPRGQAEAEGRRLRRARRRPALDPSSSTTSASTTSRAPRTASRSRGWRRRRPRSPRRTWEAPRRHERPRRCFWRSR